MQTIGQIVYKYQDPSGKTWYSDKNQKLQYVNSIEEFNQDNCYWNLIEDLGNSLLKNYYITKLGIQAPFGSIVIINGHEFYIGQSKMLELNDEVNSLHFKEETLPSKNVIIDYAMEAREG